MNGKKVRKVIIGIVAILILIAGILFAAGYFYYAKIIQNYLTETVKRESKGLYQLHIGSLSLNVLSGNLTLDKFSLVSQDQSLVFSVHIQYCVHKALQVLHVPLISL